MWLLIYAGIKVNHIVKWDTGAPFITMLYTNMVLTLIPAWIDNYIHYKVWDENY